MTDSIAERVRRIATGIFQVPLDRVRIQSSPETIETWDSLQHLNLVLELEQVFGVRFSPDEMAQMVTVEAIVGILERKGLPEADSGS
jgi:acyl carrier protein